MLINVSTRKFARSVRLPEGDVPAPMGSGLSKSAASRHFVALSAARMKEWIASDLSGLDLLVIQIDGIHMDEELILVAAIGVDAKGDKHPLAGARSRWRCAGPQPLCGKQPKASDKAHKQLPALCAALEAHQTRETQPVACLLAKPTQLNINLSSGRFAMHHGLELIMICREKSDLNRFASLGQCPGTWLRMGATRFYDR